jgi:hypothetical protein
MGLEVKAAVTWRSEYGTALKSLMAQGSLRAAYGVYLGDTELKDEGVRVFPIKRFFQALASGNILVPGRGK